MGVWALVQALSMFLSLMTVFSMSNAMALATVGVPMLMLFALSYVLVFKHGALAIALAPDGGSAQVAPENLARVLVVLLGVYLLVLALPELINAILAFYAAGEFPVAPRPGGPLGIFVRPVVTSGIALYLLRRPDRIVDLATRAGERA